MNDGASSLWIAFYTEGLTVSGGPIDRQSIGGSESALWHMAYALARRGHRVTVFCKCSEPGVVDGVRWDDYREFPQQARAQEWDLFIASRFYPVLALPLRTKMNWLWLHDMPTHAHQLAAALFQTTQVMPLSDFHRQAYLAEIPEIAPLLWTSRNGVDLALLRRYGTGTKHPKRLLYASRPERGLDVLLTRVWPALLRQDPDLELAICGYNMEGWAFPQQLQDFYAYCSRLIKQAPGAVTDYGALTKADYYRLLSSCAAVTYPTAFPEISCLVALEAMALGVPVVTTDNFALRETVPYEKVPGPPLDDAYVERFVQRTLQVLTDPLTARRLQKQGREWVERRYQWAQVAAEWEARAWQLFEERRAAMGRQICARLLFNSDLVAADLLALERGDADLHEEIAAHLTAHHARPDAYFDHSVPDTEWAVLNVRFRRLLDLLPPPRDGQALTVLDLGCGSGALLGHLLRERPDVSYALGVDFSPQLIAYATDKARREGLDHRLEFLCADLGAVPEGRVFDVVIAAEVLEHTIDYWTLVDACEAHCRPGGTVVFTVPSGPWEAGSYHVPAGQLERYHVHHFELRDLEEVFGQKHGKQVHYAPASLSTWGDLLGWWFVVYEHRPGRKTGRVDYRRKHLTTVPYEAIAACLIAKNEENDVHRTIKSLIGVVDEIWLWDCGSTDRTAAFAREYEGLYWPRVYVRRLNPDPDGDGLGNFGAWRNQSISETRAEWVYWQDLDEQLVGYRNLRKYATAASFYNAYVIQQHHLQLLAPDPIEADRPQRLFRNHRGYQFTGVVHEQVEDGINTEVQPSLLLPDVHIAHFGYLTSEQTRRKCFERNLPLLRKDRLRHPERALGPLLVLRDYINLAQILLEEAGGRVTNPVVEHLRNAVLLYFEHYAAPANKYHRYAFKYYQYALRWLGRQGIPVRPEWGLPFEVQTALGFGIGGFSGRVEPESRWFASPQELLQFLGWQGEQIVTALRTQQGLT
jgi:glycosyltransferase involved in cell wall biosynthesis/SAM-dependent methyltransferase